MDKNIIYLAGKAHGNKWKLANKIVERNVEFIASDDGNDDESDGGHGGHGDHTSNVCNSANAVAKIERCNMLIAYLDRPDSYGSIAEISWAAAKSKSCYLIIVNPKAFIPVPESEAFDYGEYIASEMYDAYNFVSNLPGVNSITVKDEESAACIMRNLAVIESPIEHMFYKEFYQFGVDMLSRLQAQVKIDNYRVDFLFDGESSRFAIELDGHEYHKTKEQRTSDAQRDRYLMSKGIQTVRFTGTEIYQNVWGCVYEFYKMAFPTKQSEIQMMSLAEEAGI